MKGAMTAQPLIKNIPTTTDDDATTDLRRLIPAWIVSGVVHVVLLSLFLLVTVQTGQGSIEIGLSVIESKIDEETKEHNLINDVLGDGNAEQELSYQVGRVDPDGVNVPGMVDPSASAGIPGLPESPTQSVVPPAGFDFGPGGGSSGDSGRAPQRDAPGCRIGIGLPVMSPLGRSGEAKQHLLREGGGNFRSEAAVAAGLRWLKRHQNVDGSWNPARHQHDGKCNCGQPGHDDPVFGTSLALLVYLGAGETHRPVGKHGFYAKEVERALRWLTSKQNGDGVLSGNGYIQGMATLALCEAYNMTADPQLHGPAQRAINAVMNWQGGDGGFRYTPKQDGDTSVFGWHVQALKAGQAAGLNVRNDTLAGVNRFLDKVTDANTGGCGYTGPQATQRMTAVGMLCRQYMGWGPRHPGLNKGVELLRRVPPSAAVKDMYYYYYATQVMHHMGGDTWEQWNQGINGRPGMRDLLIDSQDQGTNRDRQDQRGSWDPTGDAFGAQFGRLGYTCLCVLTLEVYYRHLPLYKKEMVQAKPEANRGAQ
jgi:hypothetical protein